MGMISARRNGGHPSRCRHFSPGGGWVASPFLATPLPRAGPTYGGHMRRVKTARMTEQMNDGGAGAPKRGWFTRLKEGLSRSSAKLTEGISGIFTKRKLDDATLEELEELLIQADLGPATAAKLTAELARTRFGKEVLGRRGAAARWPTMIAQILRARGQAAALLARAQAAGGAGGRRQRHRQDHDHRQAGRAVARGGPVGDGRGRRHLPRRRGRAAAGLGRARRLPGGHRASPAPTPPASPSTR